jgi:hypothetical protein
MSDTDYFLIVAILGCLFAAVELAGQRLKGWHTISWWASQNPKLRWGITGLFLIGGIGGAVWFGVFHAYPGHIPR